MTRFFVAGIPKAQPRPRAFARKMGDRYVARVYDAGTAEHWKSQIALVAKPFFREPIIGAVRLSVTFVFPRPKSHLRSNGELRPKAPVHHISRPDCDNLIKAVKDSLTQLGAWKDDSQVIEETVRKSYGRNVMDLSGALVEIEPL